MNPHSHAPSPQAVRRPSAVSTSLWSTPAIDVDLHLVLTRERRGIARAVTFVRVSLYEDQIAIELFVSEREVAPGTDVARLAASQALALRRHPAFCREFVSQAIMAATAFSQN